ncbi:MAG: hypothetical protein NC400_03190 [Clostridium sp.]|nr:hypothetical protein [Clostridium sp.]
MYSVKNTCYPSLYSYKSREGVSEKSADAQVSEESGGMETRQTEPGTKAEKGKGFREEEAATLYLESLQERKEKEQGTKEQEEEGEGLITKLLNQAEAIKECFDKEKQTNLYDATMDLMAIASAERETALKAIQVRLMFKLRVIKTSGAKSGEIQVAANKIKKVLGKLKTKIKKLKEEAGIEQKRKNAEKAKQRRMAEKLRRELEVKRTIRKKREQKDVEESRMGMGANYGGPSGGGTTPMEGLGLSGIAADSSLSDLIAGDSGLGMTADMAASIDISL